MAGGAATRMGGVEKPIVPLDGRPLIAYVIDALAASQKIGHIYVAVSGRVPMTVEYIKTAYGSDPGVSAVMTPGAGYVEDTAYAAEALGLSRPFLVISSDVPLATPEVIDEAVTRYEDSGCEALSVRVDASSLPPGLQPDTILEDDGKRNVPAGINIVDGRLMGRYQRELILVVTDGRLAVNVNRPKDIAFCERIIRGERSL
ncbi:MAG: Adenosylcobinamide-phosphate guanylyltransferase [Methanocella sp. PtaU1.Bin125]|nr:MAG: Adenosylcobinamide-phosphate guanylyltransferase [Methanocella sp. PtaU1.Bin125]